MESCSICIVLFLMLNMNSSGYVTCRKACKIGQKLKEVADWEHDQTRKVIAQYESARMITRPVLYGFSMEDAVKFQDRMLKNELIQPKETRKCKRKLPKYTNYKIDELYDILKNTKCKGAPTTKQTKQKSRKRREAVMTNTDGSITTIRRCLPRGGRTANDNLQLCTECQAITKLPGNVYPRFINEVICDHIDNECLTGSGQCAERSIKIPFRRDTNNLGTSRLGEWTEYMQPIRTGCSCEVFETSPFRYFI